MSCRLQISLKRTTGTPSRRTFKPPNCVRTPQKPHTNDYNLIQKTKAWSTVDPSPGQLSLTELKNHKQQPRLYELSRRSLLAHCAFLSSIASLAGLPLSARPSVAAVLVDEDVAATLFQAISPSVASIAVVRPVGGAQLREVIGSGVVWDAVGPHVLTNFHIVPPLQGTSTLLEVTVQDTANGTFTTLPARVAGTDSLHDLAVLKLLPKTQATDEGGGAAIAATGAPENLPTVVPIHVAAPGDLRVGQFVYALGCVASDPTKPTRSLSAGLVSGLGRSIPSPVGARIYGVVQTEAVVNAANSGGPLVDSLGRMVGLNTAVGAARSSTARGSGVSFALPVDLLLDLVPKLIVYGNAYGKK